MSEVYVGEIKMFAGTFAPRGYALCDGQLLAISQNEALFSLLGTIYGGDGRTTFGLPDLRGRLPVHEGQGPGLSERRLGSNGGSETVTLTANQSPSHTHAAQNVTNSAGSGANPVGNVPAVAPVNAYSASTPNTDLGPAVNSAASGGSQSHNNLMPAQCVNFIIALFGIYPSRN
jgi:microcystin-dependent protein